MDWMKLNNSHWNNVIPEKEQKGKAGENSDAKQCAFSYSFVYDVSL